MTLESLTYQNECATRFYRINLFDTIEKIHTRLCEDEQFRSWMACPHNSLDDLFDQFMLIVEDEIAGTIDFSKGVDGFIEYNMLTEKRYYNDWTRELFGIVRNSITGKN